MLTEFQEIVLRRLEQRRSWSMCREIGLSRYAGVVAHLASGGLYVERRRDHGNANWQYRITEVGVAALRQVDRERVRAALDREFFEEKF